MPGEHGPGSRGNQTKDLREAKIGRQVHVGYYQANGDKDPGHWGWCEIEDVMDQAGAPRWVKVKGIKSWGKNLRRFWVDLRWVLDHVGYIEIKEGPCELER